MFNSILRTLAASRLWIGVGAAAVLVAGLFVATTFAEPPAPAAGSAAKGNLYDTFITRLAQNLGISRETLDNGITQTRNQLIDEAVQTGRLTQEQADKLKAQPNGAGLGFLKGHGKRGGAHRLEAMGRGVVVQALANLLSKQPDEVATELRSGKTVDQFLQENNLTREQLGDEMAKLVKPKLDQAVQAGKLTQAEADQILDHVKKAPLEGKGEPKGFGPRGRGHGQPPPARS